MSGRKPAGILWVVFDGDSPRSTPAAVRWIRRLPGEQFRKYVLLLSPATRFSVRDLPSDAEVWPLYDIISPHMVAQFVLEFIASRSIDLINIVGSRLGADLIPTVKDSFPLIRAVVDEIPTVNPEVNLLRYMASRYGNIVDTFIVGSEEEASDLERQHIPVTKIEIVDRDSLDPEGGAAALHEKTFRLLLAEMAS